MSFNKSTETDPNAQKYHCAEKARLSKACDKPALDFTRQTTDLTIAEIEPTNSVTITPPATPFLSCRRSLRSQHRQQNVLPKDDCLITPRRKIIKYAEPNISKSTFPVFAEELSLEIFSNILEIEQSSAQIRWLCQLKYIFESQLPQMPREYVTRLVFDPAHKNLALITKKKGVVGGICFRDFCDKGFIELVFLAVNESEQVKGYGSLLINNLKQYLKTNKVYKLLTYADENAVGFFEKHNFTRHYSIPLERFTDLIKHYRGAILMECTLRWNKTYYENQSNIFNDFSSNSAFNESSAVPQLCSYVFPDLANENFKDKNDKHVFNNQSINSNEASLSNGALMPKCCELQMPLLTPVSNTHNFWPTLSHHLREQLTVIETLKLQKVRLNSVDIGPLTNDKRKFVRCNLRNDNKYHNRELREIYPKQKNNTIVSNGDIELYNVTIADQLWDVLSQLKANPNAKPFRKPVSRRIRIYYTIIKRPMDLSQIEEKLELRQYNKVSEFVADFALLFNNCFTFNEIDSICYFNGYKLNVFFNELMHKLFSCKFSIKLPNNIPNYLPVEEKEEMVL